MNNDQPDWHATRREGEHAAGAEEGYATRREDGYATRRESAGSETGEGGAAGRHRQEPAAASDPRLTHREVPAPRRDGQPLGGEADSGGIVGLPPALRERYSVLGELPNPGTEADVLLVRDHLAAVGDERRVVKVYRQGMHADQAVWATVRALSSASIVQFVDTGTSGGRDYEVMEYLSGGNLTQLAARQGGRLPLGTVTEVVRQVADGLVELHRRGIVHRDLKPENVLVRATMPLDIVVTDFGLSRVHEQSMVAASRSGTLAYLAPEILLSTGAQSSKARDWWALGMIARELLTGVRPFEEMTAPGIERALLLRPVDLGDIEDHRARLLCRGLLIRDPADRWGAEQVAEWLRGGSPPVTVDEPAEAGAVKPFVFEKVPYRERKALAKAFIRSWEQAARRYFTAMGTQSSPSAAWKSLREWLEQFSDAEADDVERLNSLIDDQLLPDRLSPDVKLLALVRWLDPNLPPVYRGEWLTTKNLTTIAAGVAIAADPPPDFARILADLHQYRLLPQLAQMRGGAELAGLDTAWHQQDDDFRPRARELWPQLPPEAQQTLAEAGVAQIQAALLYLALDPDGHGRQLHDHVATSAGTLPVPVPWYERVRTAQPHPTPFDDVAQLALFPVAARHSAGTARMAREKQEAESRSQELWRQREQRRLAGAPAIPRVAGYLAIVGAGMLVLLVISIEGNPVGQTGITVASIAAGLGVILAIAGTEIPLAQRLGSDYPAFAPLSRSGARLQRAGARVRGPGQGCLLIIGGLFLLSTAFKAPVVIYLIAGGIHLRSWWQRRADWTRAHEMERRQALGDAAPLGGS